MKKIVALLMVLALVAGAFAADVSAKVKLDGNLAAYDGENFSALSIGHALGEDWNPVIALSVEGDNYGASTSFYVNDQIINKNDTPLDPDDDYISDYIIAANQWNIWFKPADAVKLSVGRINKKGNMETIDWWNCLVNWKDEWGYEAEFYLDALTLGFGLHQKAEKFWLAGSDIAGVGSYIDFALNDDSSISAIFDANNSFDTIEFEAGYKGAFGDLGLFVDGAFKLDGGDASFGADFDLTYGADAFTFETYAQFWNAGEDNSLLLWLYGTLNVDPVTLYAKFQDENLLADAFVSTIQLGVNGSVGEMGWDVCAQFDIDDGDFGFSVPVYFTVAF